MQDGKAMTAAMLPLPSADAPMVARAARRPSARLAAPARAAAGPDFAWWATEPDIVALWRVEKAAIDRAIELCRGNVPRAAAFLSVSPSTIYRKKQAWTAGEEG